MIPSCAKLLDEGWVSGIETAAANFVFSSTSAFGAYEALDQCACPFTSACGDACAGEDNFCLGSAPPPQCNDCLNKQCASELAACRAN